MKELLTQYELALEIMYQAQRLMPEDDHQARAVNAARIKLMELVVQDIAETISSAPTPDGPT
tara:strand:- start:306 stop:491 length:186 start_codon:yes stop_codon:yes gene_type:complete